METKRPTTKYEWDATKTILTAAMPGGFMVSIDTAKAQRANPNFAAAMQMSGVQHTMSDRGAVSAGADGKVDPAARAKRVEAWARHCEAGGDPTTAPAIANPIPGLQAACQIFGIDTDGMTEADMRAALAKYAGTA